MASKRWHEMNNTVNEIARTTAKLEVAMCHCMVYKNSIVRKTISELSEKREKLYSDLNRQCEEWIEQIDKEGLCKTK